MAISKKKLLMANLHGVMQTLERTPPAEKKSLISLQLAIDFNRTLESVSAAFPDLAEALPKPLSVRGPMTSLGKAPASFLDLEIASEQLLNLLNLVDE